VVIAESGNTIRRIVVVLHTAIAIPRTGLEAVPEVILYRTANAPRRETSVDKGAISGATTVWVIVVASAIEVAPATVAIVAASVIAVVLATAVVSVIVVALAIVVIAAASAIVVVSVIVATPEIAAIVVA
jgi:hypothetical protein